MTNHHPPSEPACTLTTAAVIDDTSEPRRVYHDNLSLLDHRVVQEHVMPVDQFDKQMADPRLTKLLLRDDNGQLIGLSAVTTDLAAVHLLNLRFFEHYWPEKFAAGHIWYVPWIAVDPGHNGAIGMVIEHVFRLAAAVDGLVGFDDGAYNNDIRHFAKALTTYSTWLARQEDRTSVAVRADVQSYWLVDPHGVNNLPGKIAEAMQP